MKIRYIRDWQNGRTVNGAPGTNCDWRQIMAIDYFGKNIAKDKADNGDFPGDFLVGGGTMWHFLTDENFNTNLWTKDKPNERKSVTIDLGDIYDIDKLVIARAKNPAICKETKTEVSVDNIVWHTIFDSSVEGTYEEQQNGREFKLQDNRFNIPNQDSSLGEIISFFDDYSEFNKVQKNVLKNNLIDKGVEVTDNDKMSTLIGKVSNISTVFEEVVRTKLRLFYTKTNPKYIYELDINTLQPIKTVNPLGNTPYGIGGGFDGNKLRLFHVDYNAKYIYELDVNTLQPIKTVNSPDTMPYGIGGGFDGNKLRLFHVDYNADKIYELDINTLQPIKTVNSPSNYPKGIGGGFDGNKLRLFHADTNTGKIYELDVDTLQPIKTVNSPSTHPTGIGGGFDGNKLRLFHVSDFDKIYELDINTLQPIKTVNSIDTLAQCIGGGHYTINKKYVIHNGVKYELKEV